MLSKSESQATLKNLLKTESVSFSLSSLKDYLENISKKSDADQVRICFGVYTDDYIKTYKRPKTVKGMMTVFICPYNGNIPAKYNSGQNSFSKTKSSTLDDTEVAPFNFGQIYP